MFEGGARILGRSVISMMLSRSTQGILSGSSQISARVSLLIIHSLKSIASGMLDSAETSKIQADVSENWVEVSGCDAEFIKTRRS